VARWVSIVGRAGAGPPRRQCRRWAWPNSTRRRWRTQPPSCTPDVEEALAAHPRIGQRISGDGPEAEWSRAEQFGAQLADPDLESALREGNGAYEQRFGHVFLICATGLSAAAMLDALRSRLTNSIEVERGVVRAELGKIVRLRLAKSFR
jgi:2-oxo-4-hydroxy-4-carboxy-5-ureidoimidazoline decarboxylase